MVDQQRFDELTKAIASGVSRRGVLKTLAVGAVGGLLGLVGARGAAAKRPPPTPPPCQYLGAACSVGSDCCSTMCCFGQCVALNTNQNCGACDHQCTFQQLCQGGRCCQGDGVSCATDGDCCFGYPCVNGVCTRPCLSSGSFCLSDGECCSLRCDLQSEDFGLCA